jgi:hypothetical protein
MVENLARGRDCIITALLTIGIAVRIDRLSELIGNSAATGSFCDLALALPAFTLKE